MRIVITSLLILQMSFTFSQNGLFEALGGGTNNIGSIQYMNYDSVNNKLCIVGGFTQVGGIPIYHFAQWDGSNWDTTENDFLILFRLPYGYFGVKDSKTYKIEADTEKVISNTTAGLYQWNDKLVALGGFDTINGVPASKIAWYDSISGWHAFDTTRWYADIYTAEVYNGELYIGGNMINMDNGVEGLAKWNGSSWEKVGGVNFSGGFTVVRKLKVYNNKLFIGGTFSKDQGNIANNIASWNGVFYDDLGGGFTSANNGVRDMEVHEGRLWLSGAYGSVSGLGFEGGLISIDSTTICRYFNQYTHSPQGIELIEFKDDTLILSGPVIMFNGDTINSIGKYLGELVPDSCIQIPSLGTNAILKSQNFSISPNPASTTFTIQSSSKSAVLCDLYGHNLRFISPQKGKAEVDVSELPPGLYFLKTDKGELGKVVVEK